jgi:ElaB/YqjD/DUF883 family membrane-anchored ribosome-binding protein
MKDTSSDDPKSIAARVTEAEEAIGERVKSATAATAVVVGHAQEVVAGAIAATAAAASHANKVLGDAGDTAQQAWSQADEVAEDVVDAGRRATKSVSRQIGEHPMISVLVGCALGYIAGWWIHGRTADHEEP